MNQYDIFISYSRKDTVIADKICFALDKAGISYFIDRQEIGGALEFPIVIAEAICNSRLFLFIGSENSYNAKFTNAEITFAFNKKQPESILPYLIDKSELPIQLQFIFASINRRNIYDHPIETVLIKDLQRLLGTHYDIHEGINLYNKEDFDKAFPIIKYFAEQGDEDAQYKLANMYWSGNGVMVNIEEGINWCRKAADQGNSEAQLHLGCLYENGIGVAKSLEEACKWLLKSAKQGHQVAQCELGGILRSGEGVEQNFEEAVSWFKKSAMQGCPAAQFWLGYMYQNGEGVPINLEEAVKWYNKSANQDYSDAQLSLGLMLEKGDFLPKNYSEAVRLYRLAAEKGLHWAQVKLRQLGEST